MPVLYHFYFLFLAIITKQDLIAHFIEKDKEA